MATRTNYSQLPEDAVLLTRREAIAYQIKLMENWTPNSEMLLKWPLRYGFAILGTVSGLSAMYINNHYRHKLRLGTYGRLSSYLPNVAIPTIMACFFHTELVTNNVLLNEECPVCLEVRAGAIQCVLSTLFPLVAAPVASFNYAMRYNTFRMPSIVEKPREVFNLWIKFTKPLSSLLYYNIAFQAILAMGVTYIEGNTVIKMHQKIADIEKNCIQ